MCAQDSNYVSFYANLCKRIARIVPEVVTTFENLFEKYYACLDRLECTKMRNVAKFFSDLLLSNTVSYDILSVVNLRKQYTSSASPIFIKVLLNSLVSGMGFHAFETLLQLRSHSYAFLNILPRESADSIRYSINFFNTINLKPLADYQLRV